MRQSWQTLVSLVSAVPQSESAGFGEAWACSCFHGPVGAYRWKPFWEVPNGAMESVYMQYALCLFEAKPKGHNPLN